MPSSRAGSECSLPGLEFGRGKTAAKQAGHWAWMPQPAQAISSSTVMKQGTCGRGVPQSNKTNSVCLSSVAANSSSSSGWVAAATAARRWPNRHPTATLEGAAQGDSASVTHNHGTRKKQRRQRQEHRQQYQQKHQADNQQKTSKNSPAQPRTCRRRLVTLCSCMLLGCSPATASTPPVAPSPPSLPA